MNDGNTRLRWQMTTLRAEPVPFLLLPWLALVHFKLNNKTASRGGEGASTSSDPFFPRHHRRYCKSAGSRPHPARFGRRPHEFSCSNWESLPGCLLPASGGFRRPDRTSRRHPHRSAGTIDPDSLGVCTGQPVLPVPLDKPQDPRFLPGHAGSSV